MIIKRFAIACFLASLLGLLEASTALARPLAAANTYVVNSNLTWNEAQPGDGFCTALDPQLGIPTSVCTLVAAVQEANADGVPSVIHFAKQFTGSDSFTYCQPLELTENGTTIDASQQWDTVQHRPGVEIGGAGCDLLSIRSAQNRVYGIQFSGTSGIPATSGIHIASVPGGYRTSNVIGGTSTGQRNVFLTDVGIYVENSSDTVISGNYIGTVDGYYVAGPALAWHTGIWLNFSGGTTISDNIIAGQGVAGIALWESSNNVIEHNFVGQSHNYTLPNKVGISVYKGGRNTIGPNNVIAGNTSHGVDLKRVEDGIAIENNSIGWPTGQGNGGNGGDGIYLHHGSNALIRGNAIEFNAGNGVRVGDAAASVYSNTVASNSQDGVHIDVWGNAEVGGGTPDTRNVIGNNGANGVHVAGGTAAIRGNYIGLDESGIDDWGNQFHGVLIDNGSTNTIVGGLGGGADRLDPGEANIIAYNTYDGVRLRGSGTRGNLVIGNIIGATAEWYQEAPNGVHGVGIYEGAHNNTIGGIEEPGAGNTIVANDSNGVTIMDGNNNAVLGNHIGTPGGANNWGNTYDGVYVRGSDNWIGYNEIAFNGYAGVHVYGSQSIGNRLSQNSIHDNGGTGIELSDGGNNGLAAPGNITASCQQVYGTTCSGCAVEIFSDDADEGQTYEGQATPTAGGTFNWTGSPAGPYITVTTTDSGSNTSAFSIAYNVGTCP